MHGWRGRVPDSSAQHNTRSSRHIARARRRPHLLLSSSLSLSLSRFLSLSLWQGGAVYDLCNAVPFVREHGVDPATGAPLKASELVRLTFHRDGNGELGCPVSGEPFTDSTKTCAVRTTGNVYSYKVVEELNLRPKSLRDLLTDEPFKRVDVLVLRDPLGAPLAAADAFAHAREKFKAARVKRGGNGGKEGAQVIVGGMSDDVKRALGALGGGDGAGGGAVAAAGGGAKHARALSRAAELASSGAVSALPTDTTNAKDRTKESLRRADKAAAARAAAEAASLQEGADAAHSIVLAGQRVRAKNAPRAMDAAERAAAAARAGAEVVVVGGGGVGGGAGNKVQPVFLDHLSKQGSEAERRKREREMDVPEGYELVRRATGATGAGFTSTAADGASGQQLVLVKKAASPKAKGYARIATSAGDLNIELHCEAAPKACENFLGLAKKGFYDGLCFHRSIRNFMIQGGDPTGTGRGGESLWGGTFKDEISHKHTHDARGVLSMANAGPDTNRSQFFVLYRSAGHLDGKHTVFGRVVGGLSTLDAMEQVETDEQDRPKQPITITKVTVFVDPFADEQQARDDKAREEQEAAQARDAQAHLTAVDVDDGQTWLGVPKPLSAPVQQRAGVGKYLKAGTLPGGAGGTNAGGQTRAPAPAAKRPKTTGGGYGNFGKW